MLSDKEKNFNLSMLENFDGEIFLQLFMLSIMSFMGDRRCEF